MIYFAGVFSSRVFGRRQVILTVIGFLVCLLCASSFRAEAQTSQPSPVITAEFNLVDHTGKSVSHRDFRGLYMLVFLGYTFCPDICPTDLQAMSDTLDLLGEKAKRIQPVFITVDPERDTVSELKEFVSNFHPRLIGLTGSMQQTRSAATAFGAKYFKVYAAPGSDNDQDDNDFYLINHSAATYLIGPDGIYLGHFPHGSDPQGMADELASVIE